MFLQVYCTPFCEAISARCFALLFALVLQGGPKVCAMYLQGVCNALGSCWQGVDEVVEVTRAL